MVHVVLLYIRWCPWPCADKKPAGQNSGDQPSLKERATDYGLLVALNRLSKARLGLQLTSGTDPEGEDNEQILDSAETNFTLLFFIIGDIFFFSIAF